MADVRPLHLRDLDYSVVQQCIHCGLCLPTCPTYDDTKVERNSPRGRIALMRSIADGELQVGRLFGEELYFCLGCLACQTACPAGVNYAELFECARADIERAGVLDRPGRRAVRSVLLGFVFTRPRVLRLLGRILRIYQATGVQSLARKWKLTALLPGKLRELEPLTPIVQRRFSDALIRPVESPTERRFRVGLLTGCVQDLIYPNVNRDTADVLLANGCEVVTPRAQPCCGSLHAHNGELELARDLARRNIDAMERAAGSLDSLDAVITNAGGCGTHLKNYAHLLRDDPTYAERAAQWTSRLKDIHEWLDAIGIRTPASTPGPQRVTYHESCHLCHGQGISCQPRHLLRLIPGLELVELKESSWCCGSAGIYNITQPEMSARLLKRKLGHIAETGATTVATSNPGCLVQIEAGLRSGGSRVEAQHTISLLAEAYRQE